MLITRIFIVLGVGICLSGCGPGLEGADGDVQLKIRFAETHQAQHDSGGLPADILSFQVQARVGAPDGVSLADTGCLDANSEDYRYGVQFDLSPRDDVVLVVSGYEQSACSGIADWMGMAFGISIVKGQETKVPIYVTRRGLRLNSTRAAFVLPRAFASATPLPDGRILIAGGFDKWESVQGGVELEAACNAVVYDPGTATLGNPIPQKAGCRGFHQALPLMDGRIMLVGGTRRLFIRNDSSLSVVPSWEDANSAGDLYDPETEGFSLVGPIDLLERMDAAAVALGMQVVLLGGRTSQLRSAEVIVGRQAGTDSWRWELKSAQLSTGRAGARAVVMEDGILLAGGNAWGAGQTLALLDSATYGAKNLVLSVQPPAVIGHSLTRIDGNSAFMAGGTGLYPGALPSDLAVEIFLNGSSQTAREFNLSHARLWHSAATLPDDRIVLIGGLNAELEAEKDLEIVTVGGGSQTLEERLSTGSFGVAVAPLPDGSLLLAGGCDAQSGTIALSGVLQILSP